MSYKARVVGAAQEILKVRVKDISGPKTKVVAMPLETYAKLRKELKIEVISVIQKGRAADYAKIKLKLPSENGIPMDASAKKVAAPAITPPAQEFTPEVTAEEAPVQNKERLEGETDKEFRSRRMKEGKALKKWREDNAETHAGGGTPEPDKASETAGGVSEGEAKEVSFDPDGAPGDEAADSQAFDPVKEQIEVASMEALLKQNQ